MVKHRAIFYYDFFRGFREFRVPLTLVKRDKRT